MTSTWLWASFALLVQVWTTEAAFQSVVQVSTERSTSDLLNKWNKLDKGLRDGMEGLLRQALPALIRSSSQVDMSEDCRNALLKVMFGIRQSEYWAIQLLDAIGKPSGGQLHGTISMFGDYDECLNIVIPSSQDQPLTGQYCLLDIRPPLPPRPDTIWARQPPPELSNFTYENGVVEYLRSHSWAFYSVALRFGVCLPSACKADDLLNMVNNTLATFEIIPTVRHCEVKEKVKLDNTQITIVGILVFFVVLVLVCSSVQYLCCRTKGSSVRGKGLSLLDCFSLVRNAEKIFKLDDDPDPTFSCLHGIRFFSMTWVVMGHAYLFVDHQMLRNGFNIWNFMAPSNKFQIIANTFLAVDSFLFLSSVLLAQACVQKFDKSGPSTFKPIIFIVRRIWRLLPSAMLAIGLTLLLPLLGDGPMWHDIVGYPVENCRKNWWPILALGNNFVPLKDQCLPQTWYIGVEIQCFALAMIYFALLFKSELWGHMFSITLVLISAFSSAIIVYIKGYPPTILTTVADKKMLNDLSSYTYFYPHPHLGVYAMGLSLGTILSRKRRFSVPKLVQLVGWTLAITFNVTALFGTVLWNGGRPVTLVEALLFAGLNKLAWAAGLAWLTFSCATGNGGLINSILSWKGYKPFNRISYLIYLMHLTVYFFFLGQQRGVYDTTDIWAQWAFMGTLMSTIPVALAMKLFFEAPVSESENWFWTCLLGGASRRSNSDDKNKAQHLKEQIENNGSHHVTTVKL